jgi:hypothetical protein
MTILCLPRPRDWRFEIFENVRGGAAEFERGFGRDRLDVGGAADAVGAEDFFGQVHGAFSAMRRDTTFTSVGSTLTSVTPGGIETSTRRRSLWRAESMSVRIHERADLVGLQARHDVGGPLTVTATD